jgi:signal transduction histidine kinase/CheY-like chemotaxis protein
VLPTRIKSSLRRLIWLVERAVDPPAQGFWGIYESALGRPDRRKSLEGPAVSQEQSPAARSMTDSICPVPGQRVVEKPEWTDVPFGDGYSLTVRVIGDGIVHSRPSGTSTLAGLTKALQMVADIVRVEIGDNRPLVHVEDCSSLRGATLEARRFYIDFMKNRPGLAGVVFCGASPMFRLSIQLARRLRFVKANVAIVDTLDEALGWAADALSDSKSAGKRAANLTRTPATPEKRLQGTISRPDWELRLPGFELSWEVIDGHIAHGVAGGYLTAEHVEPAFDMNNRVAEFIGASSAPAFAVVDVAGVDGITINGRRSFVRAFRELQENNPIRLLVFYGANVLLRGALAIWRPLLPLPVVTTRDLESALQVVRDGRPRRRWWNEKSPTGGEVEPVRGAGRSVESSVDELLRFLGNIDWESDGVASEPEPITSDDVLAPVYDAVTLLKSELDQQLREREDLEAKLRHALRMEAIGTLAGGIAHNFNNLLMGIQGNVSLIRREIEPGHPHHDRLGTIEELVQGGSKLTSQLLGYARAGRYEVHAIDLNELVRRTADTFSLARKEIRVHQSLGRHLLPVRADRGQMEQVLLNLFVNAAEAMPTGGDLYLTTSVTSHLALQGKQYQPKPGTYVVLSVRDTGVGMDEEKRLRIFDPFYTTKGMSGGTGLGLASVYGTVKAHAGYIEVESEVGIGSTFAVYLPATEESIRAAGESTDEVVLGKGTVLVVDDDEAVLEACASILSLLRYTPVCAASGNQALEIFRERAREIDLVILDMILPDVSGGSVYDSIKAIDPVAKVLLASGYSINGQAERILERGCDDFIQKPFTIEQLSEKIGAVLGRA